QPSFAFVEGRPGRALRRRSLDELGELDFDGNAIGGLAIGEDRTLMFETTDWIAPQLPADKPRYFMGIGDPEGILETIEAGVDLFDCVLPTPTPPPRSALTRRGPPHPPQPPLAPHPPPPHHHSAHPPGPTPSAAHSRHP